MTQRTKRLLLWCAATDATFELARVGDRTVLAGRCIHCKRKLAVDLEGNPLGQETVEHIIPRTFTPSSRTRIVLGCACARSDTLASLGLEVRLAG